MSRGILRAALLVGLATALLPVATACGTSSKSASTTAAKAGSTQVTGSITVASTTVPGTSAPATIRSTTTTATSSPAPTSTTTAPNRLPARCHATQLSITAGPAIGGMGHEGVPLLWTNKSQAPCLMTGWAGADGLDANGASAAHAERALSGYLGGLTHAGALPEVVLAPGRSASSLVEGTSVPPGSGDGACAQYVGLLVTPPEDTTSIRLDARLPACSGLSIHPVVPGTTGSDR